MPSEPKSPLRRIAQVEDGLEALAAHLPSGNESISAQVRLVCSEYKQSLEREEQLQLRLDEERDREAAGYARLQEARELAKRKVSAADVAHASQARSAKALGAAVQELDAMRQLIVAASERERAAAENAATARRQQRRLTDNVNKLRLQLAAVAQQAPLQPAQPAQQLEEEPLAAAARRGGGALARFPSVGTVERRADELREDASRLRVALRKARGEASAAQEAATRLADEQQARVAEAVAKATAAALVEAEAAGAEAAKAAKATFDECERRRGIAEAGAARLRSEVARLEAAAGEAEEERLATEAMYGLELAATRGRLEAERHAKQDAFALVELLRHKLVVEAAERAGGALALAAPAAAPASVAATPGSDSVAGEAAAAVAEAAAKLRLAENMVAEEAARAAAAEARASAAEERAARAEDEARAAVSASAAGRPAEEEAEGRTGEIAPEIGSPRSVAEATSTQTSSLRAQLREMEGVLMAQQEGWAAERRRLEDDAKAAAEAAAVAAAAAEASLSDELSAARREVGELKERLDEAREVVAREAGVRAERVEQAEAERAVAEAAREEAQRAVAAHRRALDELVSACVARRGEERRRLAAGARLALAARRAAGAGVDARARTAGLVELAGAAEAAEAAEAVGVVATPPVRTSSSLSTASSNSDGSTPSWLRDAREAVRRSTPADPRAATRGGAEATSGGGGEIGIRARWVDGPAATPEPAALGLSASFCGSNASPHSGASSSAASPGGGGAAGRSMRLAVMAAHAEGKAAAAAEAAEKEQEALRSDLSAAEQAEAQTTHQLHA